MKGLPSLFPHGQDSSDGRAVQMKCEGYEFESHYNPQFSVMLTEGQSITYSVKSNSNRESNTNL